ncbi:MAG: 3-oxosteroid 1-dehydrogenase [Bacteroidia bacterium]
MVGSGAGGLTAALRAAHGGLSVLVLEKSPRYGGTSATSGGGIWIPCNHLMPGVGIADSNEEALAYMRELADGEVPDDNIMAFVDKSPQMLRWLEDHSEVQYMSMEHYADYYQAVEGAKPGGRSLDPYPYTAKALGEAFRTMQPSHPQTTVMGMMAYSNIEGAVLLGKRPGWFGLVCKLAVQYFSDIPWRFQSKRSRRLTMGNALIGRLRKSLMKFPVEIRLSAPVKSLMVENGRVCGVVIEQGGQVRHIGAEKGVILAAGGFEHSDQLRKKYLPNPTEASWSSASPYNTGDMLVAAQKLGAKTALLDEAWWGPSMMVDGEDRSRQLFTERSMPGAIMVNKDGKRFVNESVAYTAAVQAMQQQGNLPAYIVFDSRYKAEYPFGPLLPDGMHLNFLQPKHVRDGILTKANSIAELAEKMDVDTTGLKDTVARFNQYATAGKDQDFNRGENAYDLLYGDVRISPNPCLAPVIKPPFYAAQVFPGDIGTKGGLLTNGKAQVVNEDGEVIPGLFAIGNTSASVTGRSYPGAGATLGPAMTFGFIAAETLLES